MQTVNSSMGSELHNKSQLYEKEIERLRSNISQINLDSEKLRGTINELQNALNRQELESSTKVRNLETNVNNLRRDN